jgi:hypothetical protein
MIRGLKLLARTVYRLAHPFAHGQVPVEFRREPGRRRIGYGKSPTEDCGDTLFNNLEGERFVVPHLVGFSRRTAGNEEDARRKIPESKPEPIGRDRIDLPGFVFHVEDGTGRIIDARMAGDMDDVAVHPLPDRPLQSVTTSGVFDDQIDGKSFGAGYNPFLLLFEGEHLPGGKLGRRAGHEQHLQGTLPDFDFFAATASGDFSNEPHQKGPRMLPEEQKLPLPALPKQFKR